MKNEKSEPVYFLLVDDLEENLLALEALLRRKDLVLLKAQSGAEALELLLKYDVALALLDVQMPEMDGFELAELMRGNERTGRVPIIFLTAGSADRQRRFRGYETGAVDFIHKPIEPDILRSKAGVFFELYKQRQQLAEQRDELAAYAEALKKADRRKDEFLAVLSHELRNPLTPILNGLALLKMTSDEEQADKVRSMMERQINHLVRLIDDLLDVSRITRGDIELRKEMTTVQTAIQAAIEDSQPAIAKGNHRLSLEIPDSPLWLEVDLTRISQVITNLLNNAAKYTQEGGEIRLSAFQEGNEALIRIADNGVGIPKEMLQEIFELFTQIKNDGMRQRDGLGIGLALARQLVQVHGGSIEAKSEGSGLGSTFTVRLPLSKKPKLTEKKSEVAAHGPACKVLVVDDNESSADSTAHILSMLGHETAVAYDGSKAIAVAQQFNPDVILLDIGLPIRNGYDVCRELRKQPPFEKTVIIALTGWGQESDLQLSQEAGFDHHLVKPVDFNQLFSLVSK